jgi:nitroreductase
MELREVIGNRRSIRYIDPERPVEIEKIQAMLEAARIASHFGNASACQALVVHKNTATQEQWDSLPSPVGGFQMKMAPVIILWYVNNERLTVLGDRLTELVDCGALGYGPEEEKHKELQETLVPMFNSIGEHLKAPGMTDIDVGQAIGQSTLVAFEQGLGTCCQGSGDWTKVQSAFNMPEHYRIAVAQTVGYPLEDADGGGQRPRLPFEDLFQLNSIDTPFPRSQEVVDQLTKDKVFQPAGPLPGRTEQVEAIREKYNLPGKGMI